MSYIQKKLGGKLRGLKFNQMALMIFQAKTDKDEPTATSYYSLVYAGLKANSYVKGEEFVNSEDQEIDGKTQVVKTPITFEMVCDWADELSETDIVDVIKCFNETQVFKDTLPKEENKKKLTPKNMKQTALK